MDSASRTQIICVLGCGQPSKTKSPDVLPRACTKRIEAGIRLALDLEAEQKCEVYLLSSGSFNEGKLMHALAERSIKEKGSMVIALSEERSESTVQNATCCRALLNRLVAAGRIQAPVDLWIVTGQDHMPRSRMLFETTFKDVAYSIGEVAAYGISGPRYPGNDRVTKDKDSLERQKPNIYHVSNSTLAACRKRRDLMRASQKWRTHSICVAGKPTKKLHIKNIAKAHVPSRTWMHAVEVGEAGDTTREAQWFPERLENDTYRFRNFYKPEAVLHMEWGRLHASPLPDNFSSAKWKIVKSGKRITFINCWKKLSSEPLVLGEDFEWCIEPPL